MPRMGGEETAGRLRELNPDLKIVMASGYSDREALSRFEQRPIAFLKKPFTAAQLAKAVKGTLGGQPVMA